MCTKPHKKIPDRTIPVLSGTNKLIRGATLIQYSVSLCLKEKKISIHAHDFWIRDGHIQGRFCKSETSFFMPDAVPVPLF